MILYVDCIGGVAGDMLLAALIDAGASVDEINAELGRLGIHGLAVRTERVTRHAIDCCHVTVTWAGQGHDHPDDHAHDHTDDHGHPHRPYVHVRDLVANAGLAPRVTARALAAFAALADAEARMHGVTPDEVHFHEVGSEDSIADVVGVAIALELLGVDDVICSPLPLGRGFVRSAHGVLPLPAPATLELLRGVPTVGVDIEKELVTPTGAALVVSLASGFGPFPSMVSSAIGYGAGGRDLPQRPNVVRAVLGEQSPSAGGAATVVVIETNLDDLSPELVPDAAAAAFAAGALDVWTTPAMMKKGRPGFVMHALARPAQVDAVTDALLRETSALGVRLSTYDRVELDRSFVHIQLGDHAVAVKVGRRNGSVVNVAPEHDDCAAVARAIGTSVKEVYARALSAALDQLA